MSVTSVAYRAVIGRSTCRKQCTLRSVSLRHVRISNQAIVSPDFTLGFTEPPQIQSVHVLSDHFINGLWSLYPIMCLPDHSGVYALTSHCHGHHCLMEIYLPNWCKRFFLIAFLLTKYHAKQKKNRVWSSFLTLKLLEQNQSVPFNSASRYDPQ